MPLKVLRRKTLFVPIAALVAILGLSACGGGSTPSAQEIVNKTFGTHATKVKSGNIAFNLNLTGQNVPNLTQPFTAKLGGPFESSGSNKVPKLDINLDLSSEGQSFTAGVVSTGDKAFVKFQGTAYEIPQDLFSQFQTGLEQGANQGTQTTQTTPDQSLKALGIDPKQLLTNVQVKDNAQAGGVDAYHVSAEVNMDQLANDINQVLDKATSLSGALAQQGQKVPKKLTPQQIDELKKSVQNPTIDLYTGKSDFILRKLSVSLKFQNPNDTKQSGQISFDIELNDLNKPQTINEPPNAKPISDLLSQLGLGNLAGLSGLSGSTGGSSSGGSSGAGGGASSGGSTPPPAMPKNLQKNSQKYLKCVSNAKGPEDLQKCVALLQGQ